MDEVKLNHIGIECNDIEKVKTFFCKICGLDLLKTFVLNNDLTKKIFSIDIPVEVVVFQNKFSYIEVLLTNNKRINSFEHIGLEVPNKNTFIEKCKQYGLNPFIVMKNEKELLFVRDFSHHLFEIKEY